MGVRRPGRVEDQPEYCPGCRERKPLEAWLGTELRFDPEQAILCGECREKGVPPVDPLPMLEPRDRQILKDLLLTGNMKEAARRNGVTDTTVANLIKGRTKPVVRRAYQMLLEQEGLDLPTLARMARMLVTATRAQWNPKDETWNHFPENPVRLGAWKHLAKLHELEPPVEKAESPTQAVQVVLQTNLEGGTVREAPGTIVAEFRSEEKRS